jgi:sarcosine oxidase subunit gamma
LVPFAGLRIAARLARFSLRGDLSALAAALAPAGVPISPSVCRAVEADGCAALWLGPDEQLLLVQEGHAPPLTQVLIEHLAALPHSLVDITQRQVAFEITGEHARTLLAAGCPLDLRDEIFPVGMCTRTIFEKCEIVLWHRSPDSFHVEVGRSFAAHVTALLAQAARELAP